MAGTGDLIARQIAVLRLCAGGAQRFSAIRVRLDVPPSTVARLLRGLVGAGLLRQRDGSYALGPEATRLGLELLGHARPATAAEGTVADLARQTGASAAFWLADGERLILAAKQEVADGFHYLDRFAHRSRRDSAFGMVVGRPEVFAGVLPHEPGYWRVAAAVPGIGAVGISRHRVPPATIAERDRRCVAAAARRLARDLAD
jgi:hypothetical protein